MLCESMHKLCLHCSHLNMVKPAMKVVYTLVPTKVPNAKMCTKLISCELQAELERATASTAGHQQVA